MKFSIQFSEVWTDKISGYVQNDFILCAKVKTTLPEPSNEAEVHTTSPVIPIVLPLAKAVAVAALELCSCKRRVPKSISHLTLCLSPCGVSIRVRESD